MAKKDTSELKDLTWDEIEKKGMIDQLWKSPFFKEKLLASIENTSKCLLEGKPVFIYGDDGKVIYRIN